MSERILPPWPTEHSQSCFDIRNQHCCCTIGVESQRMRMAGPWAIRLLREAQQDLPDGNTKDRIVQFFGELGEGRSE